MPTTPPLPEPTFLGPGDESGEIFGYTDKQMHAYVEADRRSRAPEGWVCVPREPTLEMEVSGEHEFFAYPGRSRSDWAAICGAAYRAMIAAAPVATPTEPAARARAEPVAWIVYLPSMQTQEIFDSQEDAGYVDWLTNYPDAEVTPLYTASQSEAVQVRATWRPIGTAPMDGTPILALCQHTADAYYDGDRLTDYGARSEGLSHVEDGPHVIVWGESYDVSDGWENPSCTIPAGWELSHDCEVMANPIGWMPVPGTAPAIPQPAATAGKAEGEVVPWGTGLLAREELANDGHVGAGPIAAPAGADTRRLDWLDAQRVAYGFADVHEGNGWEISGAYGSIRQAIDHESGTTGEASHG